MVVPEQNKIVTILAHVEPKAARSTEGSAAGRAYRDIIDGRKLWPVWTALAWHLVDVMRAPLLGNSPSLLTIAVVVAMAFAGWFATYLLFALSATHPVLAVTTCPISLCGTSRLKFRFTAALIVR